MPKPAKRYEKEIKKDINTLNISFGSDNEELSEDVQLGNSQFTNAIHFLGTVVEGETKGLAFASPAHQEISKDLSATIFKLQNAITQNTESKDAFDYEKWNGTMSVYAQNLTNQLREFNNKTDYAYINNGNMRLLQKFSDKLNQTVNKVAAHELQEDTTKMMVEYNSVLLGADDTKEAERKMMDAFVGVGVHPQLTEKYDTMLENDIGLCNKNIDDTMNAIVSDEKELYHSMGKDPKLYAKCIDKTILDIRSNSIDIEELTQKYNKGDAKLASALGGDAEPGTLNHAIFEREKIARFLQGTEGVKPDEFKRSFLESDPLDLFKEGKDKENRLIAQKIAETDNAKLKKMLQNKLESCTEKVYSFSAENRKEVNQYFEFDKARDDLRNAKAEKAKNVQILGEKVNVLRNSKFGQEHSKNLDSYLEGAWKTVSSINSKEVIAKEKQKVQDIIDKTVERNKTATQLNQKINAEESLVDTNRQALKNLSELKAPLEAAKKAKAVHTKVYNDFAKKKDAFLNEKGRKNAAYVTDRLKRDLEGFSQDLMQCKRSGHKDTKEFTEMREALEKAKADPNPETLKALSTAADQYLVEKGTRNPFATKMRRHRIDMAKKLSGFAKEQGTVMEAAKESTNALEDIAGGIKDMKNINTPENVWTNNIKNSRYEASYQNNKEIYRNRFKEIVDNVGSAEQTRDIKTSVLSGSKNKTTSAPDKKNPQMGLQ